MTDMEDYDDDFDICQTCGGDGYLEACEAYCDWVNYGNELVVCPKCGGDGCAK